jgi:Carboxypeptidase regulatory-like domain
MKKVITIVLGAAMWLVCTASIAHAQATIAGTVRDSSGGVLPGVTVEATSPVLTEKSRTAVSDGTGQYRIVTLPPGTYTVTFTLTGFSTVKRDNITVSGQGVIPINADLRVGSLQETITVSGVSPVVDTQTTRRETVVNQETINALPITRNYGGVLYATPGLQVQPGVNNNALMPGMSLFSAHGGISTEGRVFVDGVSVNGPFGQNSVTQFAFDVSNAQEMQVLVGGGLGESETGGPIANIIPKSGGNVYNGNFFLSGTTSRFQSNNVTDALRSRGIANPPTVRKNWDGSAAIGGPIQRDRLWFYANFRSVGIAQVVAGGLGPNRNLGDNSKWLYAPEPGIETRFTESKLDFSGRLTGQVTPKNRVTFSYQPQYRCLGSTLTTSADGCRVRGSSWIGAPFGSETTAPEAGPGYQSGPVSLTQATYTSPVSNKHLIDAAISRFWYGIIGSGYMPPDSPMGLVGVTEASNIYGRPNISYRAGYGWGEYDTVSWNWRAAWSYVTGGHSAKLGYQGTEMKYDWVNYTNPSLMRYSFNASNATNPATAASCVVQDGINLCPTAVNYTLSQQWENANRAVAHSVYLQDQWTRNRMTVQGAIRYDYVYSWAPAEHNGTDQTTRFNLNPVRFDRTVSVSGYHDISPRFGVAYDLFGDGKTALKASAGRYLSAATADGVYSSQSPGANFVRSVTNRSWTDSNGNFLVDCDLLRPAAQNASATGGDVCGALVGNNLNFGNLNPNVATVDPSILHGYGIRPYNWSFGGSVQRELYPGVSLEVGYNRRTWGNFFVTYNQLVSAADYDQWTVPVPNDSRLPNAGSSATFVAITPAASARGVQDFMTKETNVGGDARTAYWHGIDVNANARIRGALTLQAGTSSGRGVRNTCALWAARPQLVGSSRVDACDITEPWLTTVRGLASYRIPKADVQVSTTIRSARTTASENASNGSSLAANYQLPNTVVQTLLGRLPAGASAAQTTTVNLLAPSELYPLTRRTEVDMRFAKILRFAGSRLDVGVDVYNLFNANTTTTYQQTYLYSNSGANWLDPTAILGSRLARFNATLTF